MQRGLDDMYLKLKTYYLRSLLRLQQGMDSFEQVKRYKIEWRCWDVAVREVQVLRRELVVVVEGVILTSCLEALNRRRRYSSRS